MDEVGQMDFFHNVHQVHLVHPFRITIFSK